ncbi:MAG TPA: hypothetical protein VIH27_00455 [Nitrososphaerales archaeon]
MRNSVLARLGIIAIGIIIIAYAVFERNFLNADRSVLPIIGVILVIIGIVTFFFGEKEEENLVEEEIIKK